MTTKVGFYRGLAIAVLLFWMFYVVNVLFSSRLLGNDEAVVSLTAKVALGVAAYLVLLLGVMLGAIFRRIKIAANGDVNTSINIADVSMSAMRSADFWLGVVGSPIVFIVILQAVDFSKIALGPILGLSLIALQNGFFCASIAESIVGGQGGANQGAAKAGK